MTQLYGKWFDDAGTYTVRDFDARQPPPTLPPGWYCTTEEGPLKIGAYYETVGGDILHIGKAIKVSGYEGLVPLTFALEPQGVLYRFDRDLKCVGKNSAHLEITQEL